MEHHIPEQFQSSYKVERIKMSLVRMFIKNFAHPCGVLGQVVAWRLDISNRQVNDWTLARIELQPGDAVLEVGFGSGRTLRTAIEKVTQGTVCGVDSSPTMFNLATRQNAKLIETGRMQLKLGAVERLPYEDSRFDKVYAVQVINYLVRPLLGLREIHRVLKRGGRVGLFFEAKEKFDGKKSLIEGIYQPYGCDEVQMILEAAGFTKTRVETREFSSRSATYRGHLALGEKW